MVVLFVAAVGQDCGRLRGLAAAAGKAAAEAEESYASLASVDAEVASMRCMSFMPFMGAAREPGKRRHRGSRAMA
jgi:hypothetical protein